MSVSNPIGINSDVLKINAEQVIPNIGSHSFNVISVAIIKIWKNVLLIRLKVAVIFWYHQMKSFSHPWYGNTLEQ